MTAAVRLIVLGTDPSTQTGGISVALNGYLAAIRTLGVEYHLIVTHRQGALATRMLEWLASLPELIRHVRDRKLAARPIVYAHAGEWPSLVRKLVLLTIARLAGAKTVLHLHAPQLDTYLARPVGRWILRSWIRAAANTICVLTPWWERRLRRAGIMGRIAVVPNPLPPQLEQCASVPGQIVPPDSDLLTVLTMTRLVPGKGVGLVIEAMRYLPPSVRLIVAGAGPELPKLKKQAAALAEPDRVEFVGWVSGTEKERMLSSADLFCLPTTNDSFGMGFLEAMAHGLPVVALRYGAISDVVSDGTCGTLLDMDDASPEAVARAIDGLREASVRSGMGRAAKELVGVKFSSSAVAERLATVLRDLAEC